jgi:hypothetical protein
VETAVDNSKWWQKIEIERTCQQPTTLRQASLEAHARNFKSGAVDERIYCQDAFEFGHLADVNLKLSQSLLEFDVNVTDSPSLEHLFRKSHFTE